MKRFHLILSVICSIFLLSACVDQYSETYTAYTPVYLSYGDLRSAVKPSSPRPIEKPGKIYFKGEILYIVERLKGIHMVDVSDRSHPQNVRFIELPGCVDLAVKNNTLYADSYVDLVTLDISDPKQVKEIVRLKDAFPYTIPPTERPLRIDRVDQEKGVVIDWTEQKISRKVEERPRINYPMRPWDGWAKKNGFMNLGGSSGSPGSTGSTFGKAGSMARFGLYDSYLYAVDNTNVQLFDVSEDRSPKKQGTPQHVGGGIETMFIYDKHMFFGTSTGMLVYSLENPAILQRKASYWHITACDPVVVENGYAYVTLRAGVQCRNQSINRLDVLKLSDDYRTITPVNMVNMTEPYGLGIDKEMLFICDGKAGLKVFDTKDKAKIGNNLIAEFPSIQAFDVIPVNGYLFMIGNDGFYLYDYSNPKQIKLTGKIPVVKKGEK